MSLWTPGGEHPVDRDRSSGADQQAAEPSSGPAVDILSALSDEQRAEFERLSPEEQEQAKLMIAQMAETRQRMIETPAGMIVANHAMGLYELAAIHLSAEAPKLDEAKVAIDALAGILDATGDRLGQDGQTLRDALAQIQLAFVQVRAAVTGNEADGEPEDGSADGSGDQG